MFEGKRIRKSQYLILIAVFAALNVISDSFMSLPEFPSGVWYSWNFLFEALTGIILGPLAGFMANFIGVMIGHYIYFIDFYEFLFTIGAPIGAMFSAFLFRGKWKPVLIYYSALFIVYMSTPIVWKLPIWGIWDTYLAFAVLLIAIVMIKKGLWKYEAKKLPFILAFSTFIGLEAEVNPRFQGTLECIERVLGINIAEIHINACTEGILPRNLNTILGSCVRLILFSPKRSIVPELKICEGVRDIPLARTIIKKGEPLCSIISEGKTRNLALKKARMKAKLIYEKL